MQSGALATFHTTFHHSFDFLVTWVEGVARTMITRKISIHTGAPGLRVRLLVLMKYNHLPRTGSVSQGREKAAGKGGWGSPYLDGLEGQHPILPGVEDFQDGG